MKKHWMNSRKRGMLIVVYLDKEEENGGCII